MKMFWISYCQTVGISTRDFAIEWVLIRYSGLTAGLYGHLWHTFSLLFFMIVISYPRLCTLGNIYCLWLFGSLTTSDTTINNTSYHLIRNFQWYKENIVQIESLLLVWKGVIKGCQNVLKELLLAPNFLLQYNIVTVNIQYHLPIPNIFSQLVNATRFRSLWMTNKRPEILAEVNVYSQVRKQNVEKNIRKLWTYLLNIKLGPLMRN